MYRVPESCEMPLNDFSDSCFKHVAFEAMRHCEGSYQDLTYSIQKFSLIEQW